MCPKTQLWFRLWNRQPQLNWEDLNDYVNAVNTVIEYVSNCLFAVRVIERDHCERERIASVFWNNPLDLFWQKWLGLVKSTTLVTVSSSRTNKGVRRYFVSVGRVNAYVCWVFALDSFVNHGRSNVFHSLQHLRQNKQGTNLLFTRLLCRINKICLRNGTSE